MGTSFDCPVTVSAHPETGKLILAVGPLDMANLAEMLDYLTTDECRENILDAATRAFMGNQNDAYSVTDAPPIHLRGMQSLTGEHVTACGLPIWKLNEDGRPVAAVASVGRDNPQNPVTCPGCRTWIEAQHVNG